MGRKAFTTVKGYADANNITPEMEASFRALFLDWLDENQEALEAGGTGDLRALMSLLFSWVSG